LIYGTYVIQCVQEEAFLLEISRLKNNMAFPNKSKILSLHPFVDSDTVLRVGGRLQASQLPYE
ncbi:hypothetical protein ILUMI_14098, partial [Ignelater luminosus]